MSNVASFPGSAEMMESGRVMNAALELAGRGEYQFPPWIFPPVDARQLFVAGSVQAGAYGTQQVVLTYRVPAGFQAIVTGVVQLYEGTGFVPGLGDLLWSIDVDRQVGATIPSGRVVEGFLSVAVPLGSYERPWPIPAGIRLKALETIRYKALPVATVALGVGSALNCMISGYVWPVK